MKIYTPEEKIMNARLCLATDYVFFGSIFFRLNVHEDDDCKTAWTDGRAIGYNKAWLCLKTHEQIMGVFVHEVLHVILKHHLRQTAKKIFKEQHDRFNRAADYALNPSVLRVPGLELPPGLCMDTIKWPDNLVEEIFDQLPESGDDQLTGGGKGEPGDMGEVRPFKEGKATPAEEAQAANEIDQWVQAAGFKAEGVGAMTSDTKGFIKKIVAAKVYWQDEFNMMVEDMCKNDYTWKRPNTRYMQQGMYLPSMFGEKMPDLLLYVDRSGSLSDEHLAQIMAEIKSLIEIFRVRVVVVYWNTKYTHHEIFLPDDVFEHQWCLNVAAGGGTNFTDLWSWMDDQDEIDPKGIVLFTDFECNDWPMEDPGIPVIWAQVPDCAGGYTRRYDGYLPGYGKKVLIPKVGDV